MQNFTVIFFRFSIFVGGAISYSLPLKIFLPYDLRSFRRLLKKKKKWKNSLMAESYATDFFSPFKSWRFRKACKVNKVLRFLKIFFRFILFFRCFWVHFSEFFTQVEQFRKATFLKVWRKFAQNRDSDVGFPVFRLSLCILRRSDADDIYAV